ncbi:hypothetical protein RND71_042362 [Anisodus tanguticus]|uniref:Chlorophyll a-b binding protein, chloroplastic n=1 Tax=Anisodus tanguticus TaxID=243964 RepID=A0AAE1QQT3_9SOLA|nr:hypothetical protein RND71_042362 [Anisodus tanguticus]
MPETVPESTSSASSPPPDAPVQGATSPSFHGKSICKTSVAVKGISWTARTGHSLRPCTTVIQAQQRPTWLPGLDPPPYLDGTLAGDFGFDPLGLGEDPESLRWYVQAELVHARFAMAGVAGIILTDTWDSSSWSGSSKGGEFPNLREPKEKRVQSTKGSGYQSGSILRRLQRTRQGGRRGHGKGPT